MPYLIENQASLTTEIRRVLRELLRDAAGRAGSPNENVHDDVHEVRKSLKKARAVLKLVRPHVSGYNERKHTYRDIGRRLSEVRDAAAVIESLDIFMADLAESVEEAQLKQLRAELLIRRDAVAVEARAVLRDSYDDLTAAIAEVEQLKLADTGPEALYSGFKREYRRGRAWARSLHTAASPTEFHEWRKRAKEHRYHLELLFGEAPPVERMHALTDTLGYIQDLTVLIGVVQDRPDVTEALEALRRRHKASALESGRAYYAPTEEDRVADVLEQWRR